MGQVTLMLFNRTITSIGHLPSTFNPMGCLSRRIDATVGRFGPNIFITASSLSFDIDLGRVVTAVVLGNGMAVDFIPLA